MRSKQWDANACAIFSAQHSQMDDRIDFECVLTLGMPRLAMMVARLDKNNHPGRCDEMCRYHLPSKACQSKGLFS